MFKVLGLGNKKSRVRVKGLRERFQIEVVNQHLVLGSLFSHMFSDALDLVLEPSMGLLTNDN